MFESSHSNEIIIVHIIMVVFAIILVWINGRRQERKMKDAISAILKKDAKVTSSRKSRINQDIKKLQRNTKETKK